MNAWKPSAALRRVLAGLSMVLALAACTSSNFTLNALTTPEPDATRQRAMRRLVLASAYFEQGQNEVAQSEVRAALQIDARYAQAYNLLGLTHQRAGSVALAAQSFDQALQWAEPNERGDIEHNYGWLLCQDKQYLAAQTHFQQALSQPQYRQASKTHTNAGLCQLRAGERGQAQQSFEAALAVDPQNSLAREQLNALRKN